MRHDEGSEICRRIRAGWNKFTELADVWTSSLDQKIKAQYFNSTVLPAMKYGCETWSLTKAEYNKLAVAERAMERRMLGITLYDRIQNEVIRQRSQVDDIAEQIKRSKLAWAGHVARIRDDRWTSKILSWYPRDKRRPRGRPPRRWKDEINGWIGGLWSRAAMDRAAWRRSVPVEATRCER